jgi:hypothetical protein
VTARTTKRKSSRVVRCEALFQVVGMYENSKMVARIMRIVDTAPPSAVADQVMAGEALVDNAGAYTCWELYAV